VLSRILWASAVTLTFHYPVVTLASDPAQPGAQSPPPAPRAPTPSPKAAPAKPFAVLEFQIEGNTLLRRIDVERAVMPYLGENKTIKDVEGARAQLERLYHDRGYKTVLVNIPPQQVSNGVVRLAVSEAPVGKLKITGSRYHSLQVIRSRMAQLNPGTVPNFQEVQKELADVNHSPDLRVTPVLRASETPGRVDVDLNVQDELPLHAIFEVNNRYSANTAHVRAIGELHYDDLFQADQSVSFQYQIAPSDPADAKIWSLSYVIPMGNTLTWALYAIHSDSNVAAVGSLDVIGAGDIYGLRLIDPLPSSSRDFFHSFTAGLDYKDFKQTVLPSGSGSSVESPVSYIPFTLQYSATWLGAALTGEGRPAATVSGRSDTTLELGLNFLIGGLGTDWKQFANKRAGAGTQYIIFHPTLTHEQVLPGRFSLVATLDGQLANGPLINNEQYAAGGADTVRGYVEAERLGDNAARGSLELRTPQWFTPPRIAHVEKAYGFLFVDAARLHIIDPLPGQTPSYSLVSAGVGIYFKARGFIVGLDGAHILKDGAVTPSGANRGLFTVSYTY
jgi:hemolysin activation/secretion protein